MTKDSEKMLCVMYKEYLIRVKHGVSKYESRNFKPEFFLTDSAFTNWHAEDISMAKSELTHSSLLKSNILGDIRFTDEGITHMENRFKNGIIELTDFIAKLIP